MRSERLALNPVEVAPEDRIERDLHDDNIRVNEGGIDWGQAEIEAFMAKLKMGAIPIDSEIPNRVISIPLLLGATGDFDAARIALQAEAARINEEGGTLKREIIGGTYGEAGSHLFADIVKATLRLAGDTLQASRGMDANAELILETLPDFYGDPILLATFEGTGKASATHTIQGNLPARADLAVTELSGNNQMGLAWFARCRNYSSAATAGWTYEAEALALKSGAEEKELSGASGKTILHPAIGQGWTPILGTTKTDYLTHVGVYDVWARVYTKSNPRPWLRFVYDIGDLIAPVALPPVQIPAVEGFYLVPLGQINLRRVPIGAHRWEGVLQAYTENTEGLGGVYVDRLELYCADETSGILRGQEELIPGAEAKARDNFLQTGGALSGKVADTGQTWAGAGDADDFVVVA